MKSKGFTLMELMITISIIGILAIFAVSAYLDYTKRAYVAEGIQLSMGMKAELITFFGINGSLPRMATDPMPTPIISPSKFIDDISFNGDSIMIRFKPGFTPSGGDAQIFLAPVSQSLGFSNGPSGSVLWVCYTHTSDPNSHSQSMPYKYMPSACHHNFPYFLSFY